MECESVPGEDSTYLKLYHGLPIMTVLTYRGYTYLPWLCLLAVTIVAIAMHTCNGRAGAN